VNEASGVGAGKGKGVVEVGAGTGYWTSLLRRRGSPVTAYDLHPCHSLEPNGHHKLLGNRNPPPFTAVERGGAQAVNNEQDAARVLLLCWPPQEGEPDDVRLDVSGMAATALRSYQGSTLVYVGEVFKQHDAAKHGAAADEIVVNGATAGSAFHRALLADWVLRREVMLPRWPGAADSLTVWSRKEREQRSVAEELHKPAATSSQQNSSSNKEYDEAAAAAQVRTGFMRDMRSMWEETAVGHLANRARLGGPRPRRGAERRAVDAVRSRSGLIRKLLLMML
jgi:hypothetical protein